MAAMDFFWLILLVIVGGYFGFSLYLLLNQRRIVYNPDKNILATPDAKGFHFESVEFVSDDNLRLHGWFVPADAARGVVLFCHGNTGNISHRFETLDILHRLQLSTFIFDYRGYGHSEGRPSEGGTYRDAIAAWNYLTKTRRILPQEIVLFGRSLGGAIAIWLAAHTDPRALVIESSFTSLPDLARILYPLLPIKWITRIRYDSMSRLQDIQCPVLVVHSQNDELIPFSQGETLYENIPGEKTLLKIRGRHNDGFLLSGQIYTAGLDEFFQTVYTRRIDVM